MVDIFDEVDEDLRAERARVLFRRYGGAVLVAALFVVVAAAAWQAWRWWDGRRDMAAALSYVAAMSIADRLRPGEGQGYAGAGQAFAEVAAGAPEDYATLARLRAAALMAGAGDQRAGASLWGTVARDSAADPLLRDLASLSLVEHQLDAGDPGLLETRLKPLVALKKPWYWLALEAQGLLDLRMGQTTSAKEIFRHLAGDATAPDGVRGRADGLLNRLGG